MVWRPALLVLVLCLSLPVRAEPGKPTVHMLSGMIASGKSTFAQTLSAKHNAVVFSADDWFLTLYPDVPVERFNDHGDKVKEMIWRTAETLVRKHGLDVVLDFSFWHRSERELFRRKAEAAGANVQLYHVHCPAHVIRSRLAKRNAALPAGTFPVSVETFNMWRGSFEPPGDDEWVVRVDTFADRVSAAYDADAAPLTDGESDGDGQVGSSEAEPGWSNLTKADMEMLLEKRVQAAIAAAKRVQARRRELQKQQQQQQQQAKEEL